MSDEHSNPVRDAILKVTAACGAGKTVAPETAAKEIPYFFGAAEIQAPVEAL